MVAELGHTHHQNHHYLATSYLPPLFSVRDKDGGRAGPYSSSEISFGDSLCCRDGIGSSLPGNKLVGGRGWFAELGSEKYINP